MPTSQCRHALAEAMGSASRPGHKDRKDSKPYRRAALNQRAGGPLSSDKSVGRRTAYLLLAASKMVDSKDASIGSPALQVDPGAAVGDAFPTAYESDRSVHQTLRRACEAAGLSHANSAEHRRPALAGPIADTRAGPCYAGPRATPAIGHGP